MPRIAQVAMEDLPVEQRDALQAAIDANKVHDPCMILTYAHSARIRDQLIPALGSFPHMGYDQTFGEEFCELVRLRSAQLGGCDSCQQARYSANSEELVCAIADPANLGKREQLALSLLTMMHTDHHAIDEDFFRELGKVFSAAEIVELGLMISAMVGGHKWLHALDMYGPSEPVVGMRDAELASRENA